MLLALSSFTAPAGPSSHTGHIDLLPCFPRERYERIAASIGESATLVTLKVLPRLGENACFGFNIVIGEKNVGWALDGSELHLDRNANGSLADEQPVSLATGARTLELDAGAYRAAISVERIAAGLRVTSHAVREGTIDVGDGPVAFLVKGQSASFADPSFAFDLNRNGCFDTTDPDAVELFAPADRHVNLGGNSYGITVAPDGGSLTLERLPERHPDRIAALPGTRVPPVTVTDVAGGAVTLPAGSPVLLYFWSTNCGGWSSEAPKIAALAADPKRGYEVVGINVGDDPTSYETSLQTYGIRSRQIRETRSGTLSRLFRVDVIPRCVALDADGIIRAVAIESDECHAAMRKILGTG